MDLSGISEEAPFAHVRQEVESDIIVVAPPPAVETIRLFSDENSLVVSSIQVQCPMDEPSSRHKHCFTSQRTRSESPKVIVEHIHDVVNEFLW